MIKAVIFDCYGVLVGTGYWNVYEKFGGDLTKDKQFLNNLLDKVNLGVISNDDLFIATSIRLGVSKEEWVSILRNDEKPNEEVFSYIKKELKDRYKLGVLSNGSLEGIKRKIPADLLSLFDIIVTSVEVQLLKPDPEIFKYVVEKLQVSPDQVVFIDDHEEYVREAEKVGMKGILFENTKQLSAALLALFSA